jgi:hypothetical protein
MRHSTRDWVIPGSIVGEPKGQANSNKIKSKYTVISNL